MAHPLYACTQYVEEAFTTGMARCRREFDTYLKRVIRRMHQERGLVCSICQQPIRPGELLTIDHWCGCDDNRPENAQPAHYHCNVLKGNRCLPDNPVSRRFTEELLEELRNDPLWHLLVG